MTKKTSRCKQALDTALMIIEMPGRARDAISSPVAWIVGGAISSYAEPLYEAQAVKLTEKTFQATTVGSKVAAINDAVASTAATTTATGNLLSRMGITTQLVGEVGRNLASLSVPTSVSSTVSKASIWTQLAGSFLQSAGNIATQAGGKLSAVDLRKKIKTFYFDQIKELALLGITKTVQVAIINPLLIHEVLAQTPDCLKSTITTSLDISDTGSLGMMALQGAYYLAALGPCAVCAAKVSLAYFNRSSQAEQVRKNLAGVGLQDAKLDPVIIALLETQAYALSQVADNPEALVQEFCDGTSALSLKKE